ncbi:aminoglycoside nucleotidyltransferase [uncultured Bacteroides sp.]|uniref:nucleotidyltransferase domain-containing protein n=1 Tax=uncultured Bacteroides sp. TaxID=162156 RepID=UPI002630284C|nr:aminoglycoside nucleotidyltransferase [uncultured Bacteroides sp.]
MITEKDAIDLINLAESLEINVFIDGGWGVDALLGEQTREHQDIDLFVEERQAARFIHALHQQGFKERTEAYSTPNHIVFADADRRTVDLHLFNYDADGCIVFEGETYPADTFSGEGYIGKKKVSCIPPQAQVAFHTGYAFDDNDIRDVLALCRRFHLPVPNEYLVHPTFRVIVY